jgi:hypothetical protein
MQLGGQSSMQHCWPERAAAEEEAALVATLAVHSWPGQAMSNEIIRPIDGMRTGEDRTGPCPGRIPHKHSMQ